MASTFDRDDLLRIVDELSILAPALPEALPADQAAPFSERVSGGSDETGLPVNADVMMASKFLRGVMLPAVVRAFDVLGESWRGRDPLVALGHVANAHERLLVHGNAAEAATLVNALRATLLRVRRALGLDTRDEPIGRLCPYHRAEPAGLVKPGPRGVVSRVKGRPHVEMHHTEMVLCHACSSAWMPSQYVFLLSLVEAADAEEAACPAQQIS